MTKVLSLVAVCIIWAGCSAHESGRKIDLAQTSKIVRGSTTKTDVVQLFGEPNNRSVAGGHETWMWTYMRSESSLTGGTIAMAVVGIPGGSRSTGEVETSTLTVQFSGDVVQDFSYSEGKQGSKSSSF